MTMLNAPKLPGNFLFLCCQKRKSAAINRCAKLLAVSLDTGGSSLPPFEDRGLDKRGAIQRSSFGTNSCGGQPLLFIEKNVVR